MAHTSTKPYSADLVESKTNGNDQWIALIYTKNNDSLYGFAIGGQVKSEQMPKLLKDLGIVKINLINKFQYDDLVKQDLEDAGFQVHLCYRKGG